QILSAQRRVARRDGLFAEPASAASVAGLLSLAQAGRLPAGAVVVCVLTGHGLKDPAWGLERAPAPTVLAPDAEAVGGHLGLASGRANLVLRAIEHAFEAAGRPVPTFGLTCLNRVPLRRGLGSSATAAVAGQLFAARLLGLPTAPDALLAGAVCVEGHADNVA